MGLDPITWAIVGAVAAGLSSAAVVSGTILNATKEPTQLPTLSGGGVAPSSTAEAKYESLQIANAQLAGKLTDSTERAIVSENKAVLQTEGAKSLLIGAGAVLIGVVAIRKLAKL